MKRKQPAIGDIAGIEELREAIAAVVGRPFGRRTRGARRLDHAYAARRIAWHVLEHAWEMQDRPDSQVAQSGDQPGPAGGHDELGAIPRADGPPARQPL